MPNRIFVLQPFMTEFESVYALIREAAHLASPNAEVFRLDEVSTPRSLTEAMYEAIESSDLLICDLSGLNPNVMYELGYAHALQKPVLIISQSTERIPFDIRSIRVLIYDRDRGSSEFVTRMRQYITEALEDPGSFSTRPATEPSVDKVFISYSHNDAPFLARLMVHLRPLEKQGLIDPWVDTKLKAGDKWKESIEGALSQARVAILLVTADFLASDFVVDNELPPILANAEAEGTRIIPVILKPCRFTRDRNLGVFQAINDPNAPLAGLSETEQEEIYDRISSAVEGAMGV